MSNDPNRALLLAIAAIATATLIVSSAQLVLAYKHSTHNSEARTVTAFASKHDERELTALASKIASLYNAGASGELYGLFDDVAKTQLTKQSLDESTARLKNLLGNAESPTFAGFNQITNSSGLTVYEINFSVRLPTGPRPTGVLRLKAFDR